MTNTQRASAPVRSHDDVVAEFDKIVGRFRRDDYRDRKSIRHAYARAGELVFALAKDGFAPVEIATVFGLHAECLTAAALERHAKALAADDAALA
ncbi:MAG: hypothetical protein E5V89_03860 [Mesorhizobium sp.]|nr:MAG: hypothetical protein E5V89_03860 [Mesorhizobium sp.]